MVMKKFPDEGAVAIDYETFYDTKAKYTLGFVKGRGEDPDFPGMSAVSYCRDPRFDPYLVSIYGPGISDSLPTDENGCQLYVGRPEAFDSWHRISHRIVLAHNAGFDEVVTMECVRRGLIPELVDVQWQDTIDLARYLMTPGSLKDSMKYLFGREISKAVRAAMDGRTMGDLSPRELEDLLKYGGDDAKECWEIWHVYAKYWPEKERKISCQLRESIIRGIRIDREYAERALNSLKSYQDSLLADLPWYPQEKPASVRGFRDALIRMGLTPPKSVAKNNPDFMEFMREHEDVPFIKARLRYAATIPHVRRLEVLLSQLDDQDCSHPGIKYFGAHSGRTSAGNTDADSDGKNVNMLNMTRSAVFKGVPEIMGGEGIDMRGLNIARPGHKFVIFDYSQIEARFSLWLVGDDHMMGALKEEGNLYQANAVAMGWCKPKADIKHREPDLYRLAKCCVLGLGYQMGAAKFIDSCRAQGLDFPALPRDEWPSLDDNLFYLRNIAEIPDPKNPRYEHRVGQVFKARQIVGDWRRANAKIVDQWRKYHDAMYMAAAAKKDKFVIQFRSGRRKIYFSPRIVREVKTQYDEKGVAHPRVTEALQAVTVLGKPAKFFTGGNIMENVVQGTCRDLMNFAAVEIEEKHPTWRFVLSVYDEVVFEVPDAETAEAEKAIPEIMCRGDYIRDWTEGLPLEVEGCVSDRYVK